MKKYIGILVLAAFASMAGVSRAAESDFAFERDFAAALAPAVALNDYSFEQVFSSAMASSLHSAQAAHRRMALNKFENDDAFIRPFTAAFAASWDEINAALAHKVVKNGDASNAAYAYTVLGMIKRGVNGTDAQILNKELGRIGYTSAGHSAVN